MKPEVRILAKNRQNSSFEQQKVYDINNKKVVYLNNGENFELQFFNPYQEIIGVEINFNGKSISTSKLIVKPGQLVTIDRFLDKNKKFLFETYEVEDNNTCVEKAIAKNGDLTFNFYKEKKINDYQVYGGTITLDGNSNWTTYTSNNATLDWMDGMQERSFFDNSHEKVFGGPSSNANPLQNISTTCCFNSDVKDFSPQANLRSVKETGRIEEGIKSDQTFDTVSMDFEYFSCHTENIKLMPVSQKPENKIERNYCGYCGFRIRNKNWSFCPKCGQEV